MDISKNMALHLLDGLARQHVEASRDGGAPMEEWFEVVESLELIAEGSKPHFQYGELYQKFLKSAETRLGMYEAQMREDIKQLIAIIGELMYHIWMLENEKPVEKPQRNTYWEAKGMLDQLAHRYGIEHREN